MPEPIVFVRKTLVARAVLTDQKVFAYTSAALLGAISNDVARSAEGRRYTISGMKLVIDDGDMFIRDMLEAEMRLTVTFTE